MKEPLIVTKHRDISDYCREHKIAVISFNEPVVIPNHIINCHYIFFGCKSFNQPVIIPKAAIDCEGMFQGCHAFNQPITIPNGVKNCNGMFFGCKSFNQPVIIPNSVIYCVDMFGSCSKLQYFFYNDHIYDTEVINEFSTYRNCPNLTYLNMPDHLIIKYYDKLLEYAHRNKNIDLILSLLEFSDNHKDDFKDNINL